MYRTLQRVSLIVLLIAGASHGQSLGDAARANREKQKAKDGSSTAKPKVIANEDLPKNPDWDAGPRESEGKMEAASPKAPPGSRSAEQWKSQILALKNAIANQKTQIEQLNDSIHFVVANEYYNGAQYNEHQVKKQESVARMQQQLEEQKKNLVQMQESARQAGMGSAVYDP